MGAREKEENGGCVRNGERVGREKTDGVFVRGVCECGFKL